MTTRVLLAMGHGRVRDDVKKDEMKKQELKGRCYHCSSRKISWVTMITSIYPKGVFSLSSVYHHRAYSLGLVHRVVILRI